MPIPLEVHWENVSGKHAARTSDISMSGCYIESLAQVVDGERISFEIQLPTGSWLPLRGEIVYHHLNLGFGVRFSELSELSQSMLASLLDYTRES